MPEALLIALAAAGGLAALAWLAVLLDPARAWRLEPVGEDAEPYRDPAALPSVCVVVPARNEASLLPATLPALLAQDYPGDWHVVLVDDRSTDGTSEMARRAGAETEAGDRLTVVAGEALPPGWAGKVWALEQGVRLAGGADRLLFTDADVRHTPGSLRRLVAEAERLDIDLDSRMARLRCVSAAERLLIPAFLFFFNLLYPMRRVNDPGSRVAAGAGGCVLLRRTVLERAGGLEAIRGAIIDDVSLAGAVARTGGTLRLALSRSDVVSLREYGSVGAIWRMVRRTAFAELRHSWLRLAGAVAALALLFPLPPLLVLFAVGTGFARAAGALDISTAWVLGIASAGLAGWALQTAAYLPATRFFGLPEAQAWALPVAGALYGGMTIDSALRDLRGGRGRW